MFQGSYRLSQFILAGLVLLTLVGCRVPGSHFGGEALQLRFARITSETIQQAEFREDVKPLPKLRRSAQTEAILLVGK